ncbi:MAG TPA: MXAN_6640 family putative metalloprotease [Marmoricola sp.]|nr:MXAN_6640 family putative metalloprotease [Marmoricola sp.]
MLPSRRGLLAALAGLLLLAPSTPVARAATGHQAPRPHPVTHGQAVAALHRAESLVAGAPTGQRPRAGVRHGTDGTLVLRDLAGALPSLAPAERRTALRILARPTDPGGDGIVQLDPARLATVDDAAGHFSVHYLPGTPAPRVDGDNRADPTWVSNDLLPALDRAWRTEVDTMGYQAPLPDRTDTDPTDVGNPDPKLDVYLANLGQYGIYGYCTTTDPQATAPQQPAYCVLDNDFARSQFGGDPADSMHATVAHEFFHAVQFSYDVYEDGWFMEGSATWMEHEVYGNTRDYLQYLPFSPIRRPAEPVDQFDSWGLHQYGDFLFFEYLDERLGAGAVKEAWTRAAATPTSDAYSLQAVRATVTAHGQRFLPFLATFARWNTLPPHSYALRATYARETAPPWWVSRTLSRSAPSVAGQRSLAHLSSADVRLRPARSLGRHARLHLVLDLPDRGNGPAATVQVRLRDGRVRTGRVPLTETGAGTEAVPFNPRRVASVVVVLTSASTAMQGCGSNGRFSCGGTGVHDGEVYRISARIGARIG